MNSNNSNNNTCPLCRFFQNLPFPQIHRNVPIKLGRFIKQPFPLHYIRLQKKNIYYYIYSPQLGFEELLRTTVQCRTTPQPHESWCPEKIENKTLQNVHRTL